MQKVLTDQIVCSIQNVSNKICYCSIRQFHNEAHEIKEQPHTEKQMDH